MEYKPSQALSTTYKKALRKTTRDFIRYLESHGMKDLPTKKLDRRVVAEYLSDQYTPSNFNHERARLSSILGDILAPQKHPNPCKGIKPKKTKQSLHKPFEDVSAVLEDIRSFNENLFLCCLLTYGCLLRPHREIRQLNWGDFSDDLTFISLSGDRNKSGRNRIVPVTSSVRANLTPKERHLNIFSSSPTPFNQDYFKTLWGRYKAQSELIQRDQTLYSFRHTGAIDVFKRTGSLAVLQQAMGHASLAVSLGYLRNLEVPTLTADSMPSF
jgi:integrase